MMQKFDFHETEIKGLTEVTPFYVDDNRGGFLKDYSKEVFEREGISHTLQEVFYAFSDKGVLRGLHFQRVMQQPKLVGCIYGRIYDVVVDLRRDSGSFMRWKSFILTGKMHNEILVPSGCAHGYLVLENSIVSYKCAEKFYKEYDDGIRWDDKDLCVRWPLDEVGGAGKLILSDKDKNLKSFRDFMENC